VILPSGKRYQFHYDNSSRLTALVTPSQRRHEFERRTMPRVDRLSYRSAQLNDSYLVDYDTRGRLQSVIYPLRARRVSYQYAAESDDFDVFYDSSHVRHRTELHDEYTLRTSSAEHGDVDCSCVTRRTDNVTMTSVHVTLTCRHRDVVGASFVYRRDSQRRVTSLDAVIAGRQLPTTRRRYSAKTGHVTHASPFTCRRHRHCVSDDRRVNVTRNYDDVNRLTRLVMSFRSHVTFTLQVCRDNGYFSHYLHAYYGRPME